MATEFDNNGALFSHIFKMQSYFLVSSSLGGITNTEVDAYTSWRIICCCFKCQKGNPFWTRVVLFDQGKFDSIGRALLPNAIIDFYLQFNLPQVLVLEVEGNIFTCLFVIPFSLHRGGDEIALSASK